MNTLTYVKLGLVGLVIVLIGAFVLAGKLDATLAIGAITTVVSALVIALGISQGGTNVGTAAGAAVVHETTAAVKAASVPPPKV
jgi:hypothetical protein